MTSSAASSSQSRSTFDGLKSQLEDTNLLIKSTEISNPDVQNLYKDMNKQTKEHKDAMVEIRAVLADLWKTRVFDEIKNEIQEQMSEQMDALVRQGVERELKKRISEQQRQELSGIDLRLRQVQIELHNSESRRANALLKYDSPTRDLYTIKMHDGRPSTYFPRTLDGLRDLDERTIEKLIVDYREFQALCSREDSALKKLNKFIQFCGVR